MKYDEEGKEEKSVNGGRFAQLLFIHLSRQASHSVLAFARHTHTAKGHEHVPLVERVSALGPTSARIRQLLFIPRSLPWISYAPCGCGLASALWWDCGEIVTKELC